MISVVETRLIDNIDIPFSSTLFIAFMGTLSFELHATFLCLERIYASFKLQAYEQQLNSRAMIGVSVSCWIQSFLWPYFTLEGVLCK